MGLRVRLLHVVTECRFYIVQRSLHLHCSPDVSVPQVLPPLNAVAVHVLYVVTMHSSIVFIIYHVLAFFTFEVKASPIELLKRQAIQTSYDFVIVGGEHH